MSDNLILVVVELGDVVLHDLVVAGRRVGVAV
jgi:hypothetical protein